MPSKPIGFAGLNDTEARNVPVALSFWMRYSPVVGSSPT